MNKCSCGASRPKSIYEQFEVALKELGAEQEAPPPALTSFRLPKAQKISGCTYRQIAPDTGRSAFVQEVQEFLNQEFGLRLPADGALGVQTRSAIRSYLKRAAQEQELGEMSDRMGRMGGNQSSCTCLQSALSCAFGAGFSLAELDKCYHTYLACTQKCGSQGVLTNEKVHWAQTILNRAEGEQLVIDGFYGAKTQAAIRRFQQRYGLQMTGYIPPQTETALIQTALNAIRGYNILAVSGWLGADTKQAIRDFQAENSLVVDGVVGPKTRAAMVITLHRL